MNFSKLLRYFPTPKYLKVPRIGLDVTDESLKFIELTNIMQGFQVAKYHEMQMSAGIIEMGQITDRLKFVENLKLLQKQAPTRYISASLPEEKTYIFNTTVQGGSRKRIRQNIEFVIEENVPLSPNEVLFEFDIIDTKIDEEGEEKVEVAVSAIPVSVVQEYSTAFMEAGFIPYSLDTEGRAIARSLIHPEDMSTYLIANVNEKNAGLFLVSKGAVRYSSTIKYTGNDLSGREISWVDTIKNEINKLYSYWLSHDEMNKSATKVIVCGRVAQQQVLVKTISSETKLNAEIANVWTNLCSPDECLPDIPKDDSLRYPIAIGLALKDLKAGFS